MIRPAAVILSGLLTLIVFDGPAAGQATVEYGVGAANAAGSAGPLKGLSNALNAALGNADQAVKSSPDTTAAEAPKAAGSVSPPSRRTTAKKKAAKPNPLPLPVADPQPPPIYEDPAQIQVGMGSGELYSRFGPPNLAWTNGASRTLSYVRKSGTTQVVLLDGKVTSAQKPTP